MKFLIVLMRDEDEKRESDRINPGCINSDSFFRAGTFGARGSHGSMLQNVHRTLTSSSADGDVVVVGHAQTTDDEKCI